MAQLWNKRAKRIGSGGFINPLRQPLNIPFRISIQQGFRKFQGGWSDTMMIAISGFILIRMAVKSDGVNSSGPNKTQYKYSLFVAEEQPQFARSLFSYSFAGYPRTQSKNRFTVTPGKELGLGQDARFLVKMKPLKTFLEDIVLLSNIPVQDKEMKHVWRIEQAGQNLVLGTAPLYSSGIAKGQKRSFMERDNCEGKGQAGIVQAAAPCQPGGWHDPQAAVRRETGLGQIICHLPSSDL